MSESTSLYERIGAEQGIAAMVDDFYDRVIADAELAHYFEHVPMDKQRRMQREFFAAATGGPIVYSGRPLSAAHHGLAISRREFQRFTEHLLETLEQHRIDRQDILDIIARVNMYADEIIGDAGGVGD